MNCLLPRISTVWYDAQNAKRTAAAAHTVQYALIHDQRYLELRLRLARLCFYRENTNLARFLNAKRSFCRDSRLFELVNLRHLVSSSFHFDRELDVT